MIVISDTSPITNLAAVGHLSLLQQLYGDIIIPERVYQELTGAGDSIPGCREVQTLAWISVRSAVIPYQVMIVLFLHQRAIALPPKIRQTLNQTAFHVVNQKEFY